MRIDTQELIRKYKDNIYAVAFNICKNQADADDVTQDTFIKYHLSGKHFNDENHIRAWLIRVAINNSKNISHSIWRKSFVPIDDYIETLAFETKESESLFEEVMKLPEKYRIVLHLFYYEDYGVKEVAKILNISESNVKQRLMRGRKALKNALKEGWGND